jgi:hypothetical protein
MAENQAANARIELNSPTIKSCAISHDLPGASEVQSCVLAAQFILSFLAYDIWGSHNHRNVRIK